MIVEKEKVERVDISANSLRANQKEPDCILNGRRLAIVMITFVLLETLSGIDQTVIATALVTITSRFHAVSDIPWITSSFFIVQACFTLLCGKVLNVAPPKLVLIIVTMIFLLGSLICAIAPTVEVLIIGRVAAGLGSACLWVAILCIIGRVSTLTMRPILIGVAVSAYGFSSLVGPILGGVLTERVSWRWCFYINLPIGGLATVFIMIFVPNLSTLTVHEKSAFNTWLKLDWIGAVLNVAGVCLFLIGLQLGGNIKPWNDPIVIASMVIGVILLFLFFVWEGRKGSDAILPTAMFRRRNVLGSFLVAAFLHWPFVLISFYMPILYQLRGYSVLRSSIEILPFISAGIFGGAVSGVSIRLTRHVWAWLFIPPFLGTVAFAFLATANVNTSLANLAGYQILVGFCLGATIQNSIVVVQAEYAEEGDLVPQATSLVTFGGLLFSAIGTATAGAIFSGILRREVQKLHLNLPPVLESLVLESIGAVLALPENLRSPLIGAYINAVKRCFVSGIVLSILAGLSALIVERKRISTRPSSTRSFAEDNDNQGQ